MENTKRKWKAREEQTQFIKPHLVIGVPSKMSQCRLFQIGLAPSKLPQFRVEPGPSAFSVRRTENFLQVKQNLLITRMIFDE